MAKPRKWGSLLVIVVVALVIGVSVGAAMYIAKTPETTTATTRITPITPVEGGPSVVTPPTGLPPAPPPVSHDAVAPFLPRRLTVGIPGGVSLLDNIPIDTQPLEMKRTGSLKGWVIPRQDPGVFIDPAIDWSVLPGTGTGTTMIFGHAQDDSQEAFNPLTTVDPESAETAGYQAILTDETAELIYSVTDVFLVDKGQLKNWSGLKTKEPERLVLVTCNLKVRDGVIVDTYDSIVWVFKLSSSVSNS